MKTNRQAQTLILALVLGALPACKGGYSSSGGGVVYGTPMGAAACTYISGGSSTFSFQCNGCDASVSSSASMAADGNLNTAVTLTNSTTMATSATIRATAQSGIVFPSGYRAGAFQTVTTSMGTSSTTLNTYLSGTLQESSSAPASLMTSGGTGASKWVYFTTTKQFDAVELVISDSWSSGGSVTHSVYEVCADGHT